MMKGKPPYIATTLFGSIILTLQIIFLFGSIVLFINGDKKTVQREIITRLYHKEVWKDMRDNNTLSLQSMIAFIIQILLLPVTIGLLVGVARVKK